MQKLSPGTSMVALKTENILATVQEDSQLKNAVLVFLGTLFLLSLFNFYHPVLILGLALLTGFIAYHFSLPIATLLGVILAFPAIAYQAPIFAWIYLLVIAAAMFEVWEYWHIFSFLKILICAPFAPFPLIFLGGFVQFGLTLGALRGGSRQSILISIPSVLFILLLSTLWLTPNSAFMLTLPLEKTYGPQLDSLARNPNPAPDLIDFPMQLAAIPSKMLDVAFQVSPAIDKVIRNFSILLFQDSAIIQLLSWAGVLFIVGWLPGHLESKHKQVVASLALILIPTTHWLISQMYGIPFPSEIIAYTGLSIVAIFSLENMHFDFSKESEINWKNRGKVFSKFGDKPVSSSGPASLDDVGGYDDVKAELRQAIIEQIKDKSLSRKYGLAPPKGVLFFGPPGTGKTMMMQALSREAKYFFIYVKCSDLLSQWYGESEKNIAELFKDARKAAPCILFFDELDAIGKKRDSYSADDVAPRVMSVLLTEIDGFKTETMKPVIIVGATNLPDTLDPALLRPGRLDKIIYMPLPDANARRAILDIHTRKFPLDPEVNLDAIVKKTERFSGADLANLVTEAKRLAAKEAAKKQEIVMISQKHFEACLVGLRPSVSLASLENYERFRMDFERRSGGTAGSHEEEQKKETAVKWEDVIGLDQVRKTLLEAIEIPLLHEDLIKKYKIKPAKGLLLFGPPGCGKTMIVRAASHELSATFLSVSGADLERKGPENAIRVLKETFNRAREQPPALIFIDEIEALAPSRSNYSSPILTQLLQELDGVKELKNVMLVGATNKPSQIDSALLRPGRFDKIIYIPPPDARGRASLFQKNMSDVAPGVNFGSLAALTKGYSGADIAAICQEAKMKMVRQKIAGGEPKLSTEDVVSILAQRRPSLSDTDLAEYESFIGQYGERK